MAKKTKTEQRIDGVASTLKAAVYIGLSAVIGYILTSSSGNPELFGPYTALINVLLVVIKKAVINPNLKSE